MNKKQEYQLMYEKNSIYSQESEWSDMAITAEDENEAIKTEPALKEPEVAPKETQEEAPEEVKEEERPLQTSV